ncbi:MAG: hypothetical protein K0S78_2593 [Thermomicrobiales bacterium]|nr:hypothetical protein [Thermomicrobiales bacterium]
MGRYQWREWRLLRRNGVAGPLIGPATGVMLNGVKHLGPRDERFSLGRDSSLALGMTRHWRCVSVQIDRERIKNG